MESIIDAHQHFWKFDPVRDSWINEEMKVIQKDFLPADLEVELRKNGVEGTVVVQSDQSEAENDFQLKNAEENEFIKGIVGWVDLQSMNLAEKLVYYKQYGKIKGFRHVLQGEKDRAFMLKPAFKRGIGMLKRFDFTYDILIFHDQLGFAKELVAEFPEQLFVVDHLAKPLIKNGEIKEWAEKIKQLASHENVYCKISGMVTEADWKNWKQEDFNPYLDVIVEAFGTGRIMFGSDYPVCLVAASYAQVLGIVQTYFSAFSKDERQQFFAENAKRFYNLNL